MVWFVFSFVVPHCVDIMGIHGLMKLISEEAPESIKEVDLASLTGILSFSSFTSSSSFIVSFLLLYFWLITAIHFRSENRGRCFYGHLSISDCSS